MAISKRIREIVYKKYNGHCAYCGKEITMKNFQVDHVVPKMRGISDKTIENYENYVKDYNEKAEIYGFEKAEVEKLQRGTDDVSNLMPSCRQCNFRKGMLSINQFREELRKQAAKEMERFQARQSADYGLIEYHDHPIVFYFERRCETCKYFRKLNPLYGKCVFHLDFMRPKDFCVEFESY